MKYFLILTNIFLMLLSLGGCKKSSQVNNLLMDSDGTTYHLNDALSAQLASAALRGSQGYSSSSCYQFVWQALKRVLGPKIDSTTVPSRSAYQFGDWMDSNSEQGFKIFRLKKLNATGNDIPRGSVIVYKPGQCGASSAHGHIEIAVGNGKACSDYCAPIRTCTPRVYAPLLPQEAPKGTDSMTEQNEEIDNSSWSDLGENKTDSEVSTPTIESNINEPIWLHSI